MVCLLVRDGREGAPAGLCRPGSGGSCRAGGRWRSRPGWVRSPQTGRGLVEADVAQGERAQEPAVVVRVAGEMDMDRAQQLRADLESAIDRAPAAGEVVVDLTALGFCDSSGLNALLSARLHAMESGRVLRLAGPTNQMLRLLEMTGARELFPIDGAPPA
ncbi:STAS domain-containing protein [Streptomyces vinaceus]|uniref:STAS domain-containing protein n=1 Tax=Streptomyces vinaceus TaxID=1960 RepID=UPI0036B7D830